MASGKSTLAAKLVNDESALILSEDDLLAKLYPNEVVDVPTYVERSGRVKTALRMHIIELLGKDASVVLDFPSNTRNQRAWLLSIASDAGVSHTLHYLECPDKVCIVRLNARRSTQPERRNTDTPEMFHAITKYFEPPGADENLSIAVHEQAS